MTDATDEVIGEAAGAAPRRADARRNRARVLDAATRLLAVHGLSVSFDEIARQAGVGVGTVYRHFPTREDLFSTVVTWSMHHLAEVGRGLAADGDAGEVFFRFFYLMVDQTVINKALCEAFEGKPTAPVVAPVDAGRAFDATLGELLARAQAAGRVRDDVGAGDVRLLVVAAVMATRGSGGPPWRLAMLIARSLLPDLSTAPVPMPDVTKFAQDREFRDTDFVTGASGGETEAGVRCQVCGEPVPAGGVGRPAKYCGAVCRQRAHRGRSRTRDSL